MQKRYNRRYAKTLIEIRRKAAKARWAKDRARRDAEQPERDRQLAIIDAENLPRRPGDAVGVLTYTDLATGQARRWTLRIGDRRDRFTVTLHQDNRTSASHGLTAIFDRIRSRIVQHA